MELLKKNIQMNQIKCRSNVQLTLDDDFNVPDVKPDVEEIVKEQGGIVLQEVKAMNGKAMVKGTLDFSLIYISEDEYQKVHNIVGSLPFEEVINMDEACTEDNIVCRYELEDLSTSLINSRKISVRAIVTFYCTAEIDYEQQTGIGVEDEEDVFMKSRSMDITQLAVNKKDTFRIKEEAALPSGKANMEELIYHEEALQGVECRMVEGGVHIGGELVIFILYGSDDEEQAVNYHTLEIPFSETIACEECNDDMTPDIEVTIHNKDFQIKPDDDGEQRILDCEVVVELDMKVYEQQEFTVLEDIYALKEELTPVNQTAHYERLLMKNNSKMRVTDQLELDSNARILQICNAAGSLKVDDERMVPGGIEVEGAIEVQVLYVTDDDEHPLGFSKGVIPFSQLVEVKGLGEQSTYRLRPSIEQIGVTMLDGREAEVRTTIGLDVIAFDQIEEPVITDIEVADFDMQKWQSMPGLVGYIVKEGDTLWDIAKHFCISTDSITELNALESERVHAGDKLLLMKELAGKSVTV